MTSIQENTSLGTKLNNNNIETQIFKYLQLFPFIDEDRYPYKAFIRR